MVGLLALVAFILGAIFFGLAAFADQGTVTLGLFFVSVGFVLERLGSVEGWPRSTGG